VKFPCCLLTWLVGRTIESVFVLHASHLFTLDIECTHLYGVVPQRNNRHIYLSLRDSLCNFFSIAHDVRRIPNLEGSHSHCFLLSKPYHPRCIPLKFIFLYIQLIMSCIQIRETCMFEFIHEKYLTLIIWEMPQHSTLYKIQGMFL
jgi:hypothetical protein